MSHYRMMLLRGSKDVDGLVAGHPCTAIGAERAGTPVARGCKSYKDTKNEVYFSAVSIWEIAIKTALRKVDFPYPPQRIAQAAREAGFMELPITSSRLPRSLRFLPTITIHSGLLVAQALLTPSRLLTVDSALAPYSELLWLLK